MIEYVLEDAKKRYLEGRAALEQHDAEGVIGYYHGALESLVRWSLVNDGADPAVAFDPLAVTWPDMLAYLDVCAVPQDYRDVIAHATVIHSAVLAQQVVTISPREAVEFARVVEQLFRKFWPQTQEERAHAVEAGAQSAHRASTDTASAATAQSPAPAARPNQNLAATTAPVNATAAPVSIPDQVVPKPTPAQPTATAQDVPLVPETSAEPLAPPAQDSVKQAPPLSYGAQATQPANAALVGLSPQEEQQRHAIEAGRKLRELKEQGLEYCPNCRNTVQTTAATCSYCQFDLASYRRHAAAGSSRRGPDQTESILDRFFSKNLQRRK